MIKVGLNVEAVAGAETLTDTFDVDVDLATLDVADLGVRVCVFVTNCSFCKCDARDNDGLSVTQQMTRQALAYRFKR